MADPAGAQQVRRQSKFWSNIFFFSYQNGSKPRGGGGGVLRFGSDGGVPLKPPNPYLSLRVILAEKGTHY